MPARAARFDSRAGSVLLCPCMPKPKASLQEILTYVLDIRERMFTRKAFEEFKREDFQPLVTSVDNLAKDVTDLKVEKAARGMTIARLSHRTERLLGPKLAEVDAEFERQYPAVGPPAASD